MNVIREDLNALTARLKVKIFPEDYQPKVSETLSKYRKTAKIPGFRPGNAPMGIIQKQFGKSVLFDEVSKMVTDSINKYISDEKLNLLGNPIPVEENGFSGDFSNPTDFEFIYEIGFPPAIDVAISKKDSFDFEKVDVNQKLINKQAEDIRRRYGKLVSSDEVKEKDLILGRFVELNEDKSVKESGIDHTSSISLEFLDSDDARSLFVGKKVGDSVEINPDDVSKGPKDKAAMLGVKEDELTTIGSLFSYTINEIKAMELAELNSELYLKLYPDATVTNEEEFLARIKSDLEKMFEQDSEKKLYKTICDSLMAKITTDFPDDFLKRWIKQVNDKPVTNEQIETEYEGYRNMLKWQLIEKNLFDKYNLKIEQTELIDFTKYLLRTNYANYGILEVDEGELTQSAMKFLQDKKQTDSIVSRLAEDKLLKLFKAEVTLKEKKVSYENFIAR
ncbi:MAG: trigger factor [Bacteroidetes bacterium]|nr:trigger factor [Bacteroidota bacterium]